MMFELKSANCKVYKNKVLFILLISDNLKETPTDKAHENVTRVLKEQGLFFSYIIPNFKSFHLKN